MVESRSYVITAEAGEKEGICTAAAALFDEVGAVADSEIALPYVTRAYRPLSPAHGRAPHGHVD